MNTTRLLELEAELRDIPLPPKPTFVEMDNPVARKLETAKHESACLSIGMLKDTVRGVVSMADSIGVESSMAQALLTMAHKHFEAARSDLGDNHRAVRITKEILRLISEPESEKDRKERLRLESLASERRHAKEEAIKQRRRFAKECYLCGRPLSLFQKLFGKIKHPGCTVFKE